MGSLCTVTSILHREIVESNVTLNTLTHSWEAFQASTPDWIFHMLELIDTENMKQTSFIPNPKDFALGWAL